jgi:hypothetical protein
VLLLSIVKVLPLVMVVEARAPPARSAALAAKPTANRFTTALTLIILMLILFMGVGSARDHRIRIDRSNGFLCGNQVAERDPLFKKAAPDSSPFFA